MPLWGNKDNAANSDIAATMQVNRATTTANQTELYGNVTMGPKTPKPRDWYSLIILNLHLWCIWRPSKGSDQHRTFFN